MDSNANYFFEWMKELFLPCCVVYSTQKAKYIIGKNNLTPAEFLKPFGDFTGYTITFTTNDKFATTNKNFKLDFFDSDIYRKIPSFPQEILENVLMKNSPTWSLDKQSPLKLNNESFVTKLKYYSYPWLNDYEKVIFESCFFSEFEFFQHPMANIFICSIKDELDEIELLKRTENQPILVQEGIYDNKMSNLIILLNDISEEKSSNESNLKKIDAVKKNNPGNYISYMEINLAKTVNPNDIWTKFLRKIDIFNPKYQFYQTNRGGLISNEERDNFKLIIFKFFNEYIKVFLQTLVIKYEDEINNSRKGFKNAFIGMFTKKEKIERVSSLNIYKLTQLEKKLYFLSIIQFHFRDYDNCLENLKILASDLKDKSMDYFTSINEMIFLCNIIVNPKRDHENDNIYNAYLKSGNSRLVLRSFFMNMRMLEAKKRFLDLPKLMIKTTFEIMVPYINLLLFEKASLYYLLFTPIQYRKFYFFQYLSGVFSKNFNLDIKKYSLNSFGQVFKLFDNFNGWNKSKELINVSMAELCLSSKYYLGSLKFYKNCLEISKFSVSEQEQRLYMKYLEESIQNSGINNEAEGSLTSLGYISIPEVIIDNLIFIDKEDVKYMNSKNWSEFRRFIKINREHAVNLTDNDLAILENLDNIANRLQSHSFRHLKFKKNKQLSAMFVINNPLNINLKITSLKLLLNKVDSKDSTVLSKDAFVQEEYALDLDKKYSSQTNLSFYMKETGKYQIEGLSITLKKVLNFTYYFFRQESESTRKSQSRAIMVDIEEDNQKFQFSIPNDEIFVYQNQLISVKAKIKNNSDFNIKRFTLFFENSNPVFLSNFLHFDREIKRGTETFVELLLFSQISGEFSCKIVLKMEEENKVKDIEVKKLLFSVKVFPSIKLSIKDEVYFNESSKLYTQLIIKSSNPSHNEISFLNMENAFFNSNYILIDKSNSKETLMDQKMNILTYFSVKLMKDRSFKGTPGQNFQFLNDTLTIYKNDFLHLLEKDNIIIHWTALNINTSEKINLLSIYKLQFSNNKSKDNIKSIIANTFNFILSHKIVNGYYNIEILLEVKNILGLLEAKEVEISLSDSDAEYQWYGVKKYKITEEDKNSILTIKFLAITKRANNHDLNKFLISILGKKDNQSTTIKYPNPIFINIGQEIKE